MMILVSDVFFKSIYQLVLRFWHNESQIEDRLNMTYSSLSLQAVYYVAKHTTPLISLMHVGQRETGQQTVCFEVT